MCFILGACSLAHRVNGWYPVADFPENKIKGEAFVTAKYIKAKRKEFGLTQVDLSQKSGVGLRFVREMEQGKETIRLDKVNQVLALFGAEMAPMKLSEA